MEKSVSRYYRFDEPKQKSLLACMADIARVQPEKFQQSLSDFLCWTQRMEGTDPLFQTDIEILAQNSSVEIYPGIDAAFLKINETAINAEGLGTMDRFIEGARELFAQVRMAYPLSPRPDGARNT